MNIQVGPFTAGKPIISVIIPTYNEASNLPLVLPYIPLEMVDEVILVDGRSTDHTVEVARQLMPTIKVIMEPLPGKGKALQRGYVEASGDILVVIDADGSNDPREIPRIVQPLLEGADFVKASRFAPSGGTTDMPRLRRYGNLGLTELVNLLFAQNFTDLCYGFHAFWRYCLDHLSLETIDGFEMDTAIYLQAVRNKFKVVEVPSYEGMRFYGQGKLKTFPDGWRVLRTILQERFTRNHYSPPTSQIGFRTNIGRSATTASSHPVLNTGDALDEPTAPVSEEQSMERTPYHLKDVFAGYLKKVPRGDMEWFISAVLLETMERFAASGSCLMEMDDELKYHIGFTVFGRSPDVMPTYQMSAILHESAAAMWSIRNHTPVAIQDTNHDPNWLSELWGREDSFPLSAAVIPFERNDEVVSVMVLARPTERSFSEAELMSIPDTTVYLEAIGR